MFYANIIKRVVFFENVYQTFEKPYSVALKGIIRNLRAILGRALKGCTSIFAVLTDKYSIMKTSNSKSVVLISCIMLMISSCVVKNERPALMPSPSSVEFGKGAFTFSHETVISVEDRQQQEIAEQFAWLFACPAGFVPKVFMNAEDADVVLQCDDAMEPESYIIEVGRRKIVIKASGPAGFFYAFQTLRQTLPEEMSSGRHMDGHVWTVPVMVVHDVPRFAHRCLKVDINEHYIPLDELMAFVEYMSMLKLNHLHLFGYGLYSDDDFDRLVSHASEFHVSVVRGDGKNTPLYSCPDDIVSRIFPNVAALAEVAWSDKDVLDQIELNRAVAVMDSYLRQTVLGYSKSVYNVGLAYLR